ncbi:MAG TPA: 8-oxo-dGTP diphosphatase MutT [Clostridiaceae bacterium]|nr:8-oxo-dGTP diphosphatase MutT [Clostridiaceae bacterium]
MKQVTAAIIRQDNKVLIAQRAADDECGLLWEFPGGKLEEGETPEECITREIKEELNLDVEVIDIFTTSIYRYNSQDIKFTVFNVRLIGGNLRLNVHNQVKWVDINQLKNYNFMPADIEFVEKLVRDV